jgi:hypothetical protein
MVVVIFLFIYFTIVAGTCRIIIIVHCSLQKDDHTHNEITGQTNLIHSPTYRVIQNVCQGFNNNTLEIGVYVFFYLIEQHSQFLLRTLQLLYMCTICDSTNINTIIDFVPNCLLIDFVPNSL